MKKIIRKRKKYMMLGICSLIIIGVGLGITNSVKGNSKASGIVYDGIYLEYIDDIEENYHLTGKFPGEFYDEEKEKMKKEEEEKKKKEEEMKNKKEDTKEKEEEENTKEEEIKIVKSLDERVYDAYYSRVKMSECSYKIKNNRFKWTGEKIEPNINVSYKGKEIKSGGDYSIEYFNNIDSGTAYVKITGEGDYRGSVIIKYTITGINIEKNCKFELKDGKVIMKYKGDIVEEGEYILKVYHRDTFVGKSKEKRKYVRTTYYEISGKGRFQGTYVLKTQKNM